MTTRAALLFVCGLLCGVLVYRERHAREPSGIVILGLAITLVLLMVTEP